MKDTKRILFIHSEKKQKYGAHYINELTIEKLKKAGHHVDVVYPKESINLLSKELQGISNILFYYSLIKKYKQSWNYDIVQGTTYTPLAFIGNGCKVISHFGSTTWGFLKNVPSFKNLEKENKELGLIFKNLKENDIIGRINNVIKPLKDISKIEIYVAKKSDIVIATSNKVKQELIKNHVPKNKIIVIYNAIEDYWFETKIVKKTKKIADLIYIGRMGDDPFTIKLKGINRLLFVIKSHPSLNKLIIGMCNNITNYGKVFNQILNTKTHLSVEKNKIPKILKNHFGDIYINTSRYEGFCLSLIEAMSQGLVPIVFSFGVAPEIIRNDWNGYIVHSIAEMNKRINQIKNKASKRESMAKNAINTARLFNSEDMIKQYKAIYASL